jgi:hypothetical protein
MQLYGINLSTNLIFLPLYHYTNVLNGNRKMDDNLLKANSMCEVFRGGNIKTNYHDHDEIIS